MKCIFFFFFFEMLYSKLLFYWMCSRDYGHPLWREWKQKNWEEINWRKKRKNFAPTVHCCLSFFFINIILSQKINPKKHETLSHFFLKSCQLKLKWILSHAYVTCTKMFYKLHEKNRFFFLFFSYKFSFYVLCRLSKESSGSEKY